MKPLHPKQLAFLRYVDAYIEKHHYPPTFSEIQNGCGFSGKGMVHYHLAQLQLRGLVEQTPQIARGLRILKPGLRLLAKNQKDQSGRERFRKGHTF